MSLVTSLLEYNILTGHSHPLDIPHRVTEWRKRATGMHRCRTNQVGDIPHSQCSSPLTIPTGHGHSNTFQTISSHYHQVPPNYTDSQGYLPNAGLTLPPILSQQHQQQQPANPSSYPPATTAPNTTGFDIPIINAPVTSAPAPATTQPTSSNLFAQHSGTQMGNDNGTGDGNRNGDDSGEYQQKGWPY